jgi:GTP-binding protein Era
MTPKEEKKKAGLAVLVGRSNVGKSTLLNALVGTKIAITSPKPQTTRHAIQGVLHDPRGQIVFVDTPGIFSHVPDHLTSRLNEKARESVEGVDILLYVVDPTRHVGKEEETVHRLVAAVKRPKILVINKTDEQQPYIDEYLAWEGEFDAVVRVSALRGRGLKPLVDEIIARLPAGEPLYPPDRITDVENRFWLAEIIREKIFLAMHEEIPYTTAVEVEETAVRDDGTNYVKAIVLTTAPRYKKMLIGQGARTIKRIGQAARKELEEVTGKKVYLDLEVDVDERWQERFE